MGIIQDLIHTYTYHCLRSFLDAKTVEGIDNSVADVKEDNIYMTVRDFSGKSGFLLIVDGVPVFQILPCEDGFGDYRLFYRMGKVDLITAGTLSLELNYCIDRGAITTFPDSPHDPSILGVYYTVEVKRRTLVSRERLLKFLAPIQHEIAYKIAAQSQRVLNYLEDMDSYQREYDFAEGEEFYGEEEF